MSENLPLEEWKAALENARNFNNLLLQLRGFGIPVVITIMGGGVAFGSKIELPRISVRWFSFGFIGIAILLALIMIFIYVAARKGSPDTSLSKFEIAEGVILWAVPFVTLVATIYFRGRDSFGTTFAVANPGVIGIVLFALCLLLGLYSMDRCYYYRLLIGAVKRADCLETKPEFGLRFSLTGSISGETPPDHAKTLITTMYWLPALGALIAVTVLGYLNLWQQSQ
jgi:hypothetical protein